MTLKDATPRSILRQLTLERSRLLSGGSFSVPDGETADGEYLPPSRGLRGPDELEYEDLASLTRGADSLGLSLWEACDTFSIGHATNPDTGLLEAVEPSDELLSEACGYTVEYVKLCKHRALETVASNLMRACR